MTDESRRREDDAESIPPCAPCNTCAFTYHKQTRTHERDIYTGGRRPRCAWHIGGVPLDILRCKKVCPRYAERQEVST